MDKIKCLERLQTFRSRLEDDVIPAYAQRGSSFGQERFTAWRIQFSEFLDKDIPGALDKLNRKLHKIAFSRGFGESDLNIFMREDGEPCLAFIDSLKIDIENDEVDFSFSRYTNGGVINKSTPANKRVFIVHGHDELTKTKTARFIEKLGFEAIILHEQASKGKTIIEKIEEHSDVGFAIVLYTADLCTRQFS